MPTITEEQLIILINKELSDMVLGPLSDSPYEDSSVNDSQQLELWGNPDDLSFPDMVIDTPRLARAILAGLEGEL